MDLTVRDAARLLHASENTIYRWIHEGTLPSYRINDKYRLNRVEVLEWATARNIKLSPEIFRNEQEPRQPELLSQSLRAGGVFHKVPGSDKPSALQAVCQRLPLPEGVSRDDLYGVLLAREALGSTAIGHGIAIPHPRTPLIVGVKSPLITLALLESPIDFGALDGEPVNTLFTILSTTIRLHLQLLSRLMSAIQHPELLQLLQGAAPAEQILSCVEQIEASFAAAPQPAGAAR